MAAKLSTAPSSTTSSNCPLINFNGCSSISRQFINYPLHFFPKGKFRQGFYSLKCGATKAVNGERAFKTTSSWDDDGFFEIMPDGKKVYLDEQDVVTFLDPPKELIPLDPSSYNPASYLWKKIADIPEERRHRLLQLLSPRLISIAWEVAGGRYNDEKLAKLSSSSLLAGQNDALSLEFWNCHKSGGSMPFALISSLKKALFRKDGRIYGRLIGGSLLARIVTSFSPLYFTVKQVQEVMATEQPCDVAYDFGDGLLDLQDYPESFPTPAKHPWPFNDQVVIYVRYMGPGVMVGQAWQEGLALEQVPKKLCNEILLVKDYSAS